MPRDRAVAVGFRMIRPHAQCLVEQWPSLVEPAQIDEQLGEIIVPVRAIRFQRDRLAIRLLRFVVALAGLEHLREDEVTFGKACVARKREAAMLFGAVEIIKLKNVVDGNPKAYAGPVAILVNAGSASGSELFAGAMQAAKRATIVGETTCGCLLGFLGYANVPGGGELAYSEVGFVLGNGKRIEGEGVVPDHQVAPSLNDLIVSRDRVLEAAQEILRKSIADASTHRAESKK